MGHIRSKFLGLSFQCLSIKPNRVTSQFLKTGKLFLNTSPLRINEFFVFRQLIQRNDIGFVGGNHFLGIAVKFSLALFKRTNVQA